MSSCEVKLTGRYLVQKRRSGCVVAVGNCHRADALPFHPQNQHFRGLEFPNARGVHEVAHVILPLAEGALDEGLVEMAALVATTIVALTICPSAAVCMAPSRR